MRHSNNIFPCSFLYFLPLLFHLFSIHLFSYPLIFATIRSIVCLFCACIFQTICMLIVCIKHASDIRENTKQIKCYLQRYCECIACQWLVILFHKCVSEYVCVCAFSCLILDFLFSELVEYEWNLFRMCVCVHLTRKTQIMLSDSWKNERVDTQTICIYFIYIIFL